MIKTLASADLQSMCTEPHVDESGVGVGRIGSKNLTDACRSFGVFSHHVQVAAATGSGQLISQTQVVNLVGDGFYGIGVGAAVEPLVLFPCLLDQCAHELEVLSLDGLVHIHRMILHLSEQA